MKFRVIKELEVRSLPSNTKGRVYGILQPGFIFDAVKETIDLDNEEIWLKDSNNFFYRKSAISEAFPLNNESESSLNYYASKIPSWNNGNFDVTRFWPVTTGFGVKVAVIDSGIYPHRDLVGAIDRDSQKVFGSSSILDTHGHGTHVSGIIAARGISDIYGVAPNSTIVPIKVGDGSNFSNKNLTDAINYSASISSIKVINLSLKADGNDSRGIRLLEEAITNAIKRGVVVVSQVGNDYMDKIDKPARFRGVVAVASVLRDLSSAPESYLVRRTSHYGNSERSVDICAPGVDISSCKNEVIGTVTNSGASMAAAFVSGIIALKLQKEPNMNASDVLTALSNSIFQYAPRQNDMSIKLPVLDPQLFINY